MKTLNNKSGFTLIEIIVVLIIVGILAAIALPNLFSNVQKSRAVEALTLTQSFQEQFEACMQANLSLSCEPAFQVGGAGTVSVLGGIADPDDANVSFSWSTAPVTTSQAALKYVIKAASAVDGTQFITLTRATGGAVTCAGFGAWNGAC